MEKKYWRSKEVTVRGVEVTVVDKRAFKHSSDVPHGWRPLPNTNWYYDTPNAYELLKAAGHNGDVIDTAVPQSWWDAEYKRTGEAPRACWTYEKNKIFGEPLLWSEVFREFETALYSVWKRAEPDKTI